MQEWLLPIPPEEARRVIASVIYRKFGFCSEDLLHDALVAVVERARLYDPSRGAATTFLAQVAISVVVGRRARRLSEEESKWLELQENTEGEQQPWEIAIPARPELQAAIDRLSDAAERIIETTSEDMAYIDDAVVIAQEVIRWYTWHS